MSTAEVPKQDLGLDSFAIEASVRPPSYIAPVYPLNNEALARLIKPLDPVDRTLLNDIETTDWKEESLDLSDPTHRNLTARGLALGVPVFHGFGNFYALTFHPHLDVMRSVNASKGRPLDQVASITTTPEHMFDIFDWSKLPEGLDTEKVQAMMEKFYEIGPFGFRGPATKEVVDRHPHLTSVSNGEATVQLIAPGYHCQSNELYREALELSGESYLAITSANLSKTVKGGVVQPAHNRIRGIQADFGATTPQAMMVAHKHERWARTKYRHMQPTSTSIVGFHESDNGVGVVTIDRHGSLPIEKIDGVIRSFGMVPKITEGARERQPLADYARSALLTRAR